MDKKKMGGELDKEARIKKHNKSKGHGKDPDGPELNMKHPHRTEKRAKNHAADHYLKNGHLYLEDDENMEEDED